MPFWTVSMLKDINTWFIVFDGGTELIVFDLLLSLKLEFGFFTEYFPECYLERGHFRDSLKNNFF